MISFAELVHSVKFERKGFRFFKVVEKDPTLKLVGMGRSAFVYRIQSTDMAMKIFFPSHVHWAQEEGAIYRELKGIPYFPSIYQVGPNYLVLDYIEGDTLFEYLRKGIVISEEKVKEVDKALSIARERGLNPSDLHLRNIIITSKGEVKIIDVARFRQNKNCRQWDDLKTAFYRFYHLPFFPKKIPAFILNLISSLYKKNLLPMKKEIV